ncbi:unnamed protein product [Calypogeia fissa]
MEGETPNVSGNGAINYISYVDETQLDRIMALIDKELSEPYSIFTYRYFITLWPHLCFMAFDGDECVGTIVCKMGQHRSTFRGYIAMLVVIKPYRGKGIATELVTKCLQVMRNSGCDEVTLEAEVTNKGALALYGNLGFVRAKRLHRYYLNGVDAYRLKLLFPRPQDAQLLQELQAQEEHQDCGHDHHNHHHEHHHHAHGESCGHDYHHDHHHHSHGESCGHDHHHPSGTQLARPVYLQDLNRKSGSSHALR